MSSGSSRRNGSSLRRALVLGGLTFSLSVFFVIPTQQAVRNLSLLLAFPVLFLIILSAVVSDVIGVAAAVAEEAPFHAMSAKKLKGARHALYILRNSDRVNSFCADMMGDLAGTLGGGAGAAIVFRLLAMNPDWNSALLSTFMLGSVAALMVGGKAATKGFALSRAKNIVFATGKVLYYIEKALPLSFTETPKGCNSRRRD